MSEKQGQAGLVSPTRKKVAEGGTWSTPVPSPTHRGGGLGTRGDDGMMGGLTWASHIQTVEWRSSSKNECKVFRTITNLWPF